MKKLIAVLLAAVICLAVPFAAFADMEGPMVRHIKCTVTNPNGAVFYYYHYDEALEKSEYIRSVIPYGTELSVEAIYDDSYYSDEIGDFSGKSIGRVKYDDEDGYILLSDVAKTEGDYSMSEAKKVVNPSNYIVTKKDGITMYKGPSKLFGEAGTIPDGAKITLTYYDGGSGTGEEANYANCLYYTEYKGTGGWIYYYPQPGEYSLIKLVDKKSEYSGKIKVTGSGIRLIDINSDTTDENGDWVGYKEVGEVIPAGTELTFDKYYDLIECYALVTYKGVTGYLEFNERWPGDLRTVVYLKDGADELITKSDCTVYSEPGNFSSGTGETVPSYTKLSVKAYGYSTPDDDYENWYLVDYNGKDAWLCDNRDNDITRFWKSGENSFYYKIKSSSADMIENPDNPTVVCTLTPDDVLVQYTWGFEGDEYVYCESIDGSKAGWIKESMLEEIEGYVPPVIEEEEETEEETGEDAPLASRDKDGDALKEAAEKADVSTRSIIAICVVAAVVVALTAAIIILLIKKKNRSGEQG